MDNKHSSTRIKLRVAPAEKWSEHNLGTPNRLEFLPKHKNRSQIPIPQADGLTVGTTSAHVGGTKGETS